MADVSITAANVLLVSGEPQYGIAGGTITAGMTLYKDGSASNTLKAGLATAAATDDIVGIALQGSSSGQPLTYAGDGCVVNMGGTLVPGMPYYLSAGAAGGVAPVTDLVATNYVTALGIAITTANLKINLSTSSVQLAADIT